MKSLAEKIAVMQAALEGKEIECSRRDGDWWPASQLAWNWPEVDYRIKPEPREIWVNEYYDGLEAFYSATGAAEGIAKRMKKEQALPLGYKASPVKYREVIDD